MSEKPTDEEQNAFVQRVMAMPNDEREAFVDRMFFDMWGVTREAFWNLDAKEIQAIAEARGLNVAGIGKGGEYSHQGDGKDRRN